MCPELISGILFELTSTLSEVVCSATGLHSQNGILHSEIVTVTPYRGLTYLGEGA